jgi:hypothetical protein
MNERYKSKPPVIRSLLRECEDGMSVNEIEAKTGIDQDLVRKCLNKMPDAYIDRWVYLHSNPTAIWCVVVIPENCPRPKRKKVKLCPTSPPGATKTSPSSRKKLTPE